MLSRVIGGLSEGNVQLATSVLLILQAPLLTISTSNSAILSDVTTPANRSKALAHVGIAFAICFCIGPPIGAYFASRPIPPSVGALNVELNIYAAPALLTFVLLVAETLFLAIALPETRNARPDKHSNDDGSNESKATFGTRGVQERTELLQVLRKLHFAFLGIFSGVEFTLTFLTFDRASMFYPLKFMLNFNLPVFDWNNKQNGALIGSIGIISALLQGGYVRNAISKVGEGKIARRGVVSCALGLVFLAILPHFVSTQPKIAVGLLRSAAVCLAFTSATVVSSLTSFASLQCDEGFDRDTGKPVTEHPKLAKGKALGEFRSSGQLGRAIGPLLGES